MSETTNPKFLDDFLDKEAFAKEVKRHPRSVDRWTKGPDGLPYTWMGNQMLFHIPTAREWLMRRMRRPAPRRTSDAAR